MLIDGNVELSRVTPTGPLVVGTEGPHRLPWAAHAPVSRGQVMPVTR